MTKKRKPLQDPTPGARAVLRKMRRTPGLAPVLDRVAELDAAAGYKPPPPPTKMPETVIVGLPPELAKLISNRPPYSEM